MESGLTRLGLKRLKAFFTVFTVLFNLGINVWPQNYESGAFSYSINTSMAAMELTANLLAQRFGDLKTGST